MLQSRDLSEQQWKLVEPNTLGRPGMRGDTGGSWHHLPEQSGLLNTVARRFCQCAYAGVWQAVFEAVQEPD